MSHAASKQTRTDYIHPDEACTLYGLFRKRVERSPADIAYRNYNRAAHAWEDTTWAEMADMVALWQAAFAQENLKPGDRVAIALKNSREWVAFDQAAMGHGLVVVPLYSDDRADNVAYILRDAAVKILLVESSRLWRRLGPAVKDVACMQRILIFEADSKSEPEDERILPIKDWLAKGQQSSLATSGLIDRPDESDKLASIVYTSGTSGQSKGVMLSHANMLGIAYASIQSVAVYKDDLFLSFLPLSHTFERTVGYYVPIMAGATVAHARSVNQLADDLVTIKPTALISVPRIFERVNGRIMQQMQKGPFIKRLLFNLTLRIGWRRFEARQGRGSGGPLQVLWPVLNKVVASKVMEKLGGRVRVAICGGAALPPEVAKTFIALGLELLQGYGLTEFSPVSSVNLLDDNDPASVGVPLQGVEVRIGENDELLLRGPGVMQGYWNNHVATQAAIDEEGWLHTGDQARIENNHVYIIGRIKEIIVMSNGEKLPPNDMEAAITMDPLFEQAMIVGEGEAYLTALVVLNQELWPDLAKEMGLEPDNSASLKDPKLLQRLQKRVAELLRDFPGYAKVRRVTADLEPWSVDNGMLTPTMKLKRRYVLEHYKDDIKTMYESARRA